MPLDRAPQRITVTRTAPAKRNRRFLTIAGKHIFFGPAMMCTDDSRKVIRESFATQDLSAGCRMRNIHIELLFLLKPDLQAGRFQALTQFRLLKRDFALEIWGCFPDIVQQRRPNRQTEKLLPLQAKAHAILLRQPASRQIFHDCRRIAQMDQKRQPKLCVIRRGLGDQRTHGARNAFRFIRRIITAFGANAVNCLIGHVSSHLSRQSKKWLVVPIIHPHHLQHKVFRHAQTNSPHIQRTPLSRLFIELQ